MNVNKTQQVGNVYSSNSVGGVRKDDSEIDKQIDIAIDHILN